MFYSLANFVFDWTAMRGRSLNDVRQDCRVIYEGHKRDDPAAFDDRAWIAAPYTLDGRTIYALIHNEFQGHFRPDLCPSRNYSACWSNAITWARSPDATAERNCCRGARISS